VTRWIYVWALKESWLTAVNRVGRCTGSWRYIQGLIMRMKGRQTILGGCCTRCMLYAVYAVLSVCCTWCMLYLVSLMIMAWRDIDGWLNFVFSDNGWVVDEKERDGGRSWERCGGYKCIWAIRGTTWLIGLGRHRVGVIKHRIRTHTCHIGDGKLTHTRYSLMSQLLMMICPIFCDLSLSRPQLYYHLRTQS